MGRLSRRGVLIGLGLAATGLGCGGMNPFLLPYIFSGGQSRTPAEFPLVSHQKKAEAKVVVFASSRMGIPPDLAGVDRMLNAEVIRILDANVKQNSEKVLVLKMPIIDKYKSEEPNWRAIDPCDIGKHFGADYVIDIEILAIDLYKPGSRRQWLQGHASVSVNAYDLSKPLKEPAFKWDYSIEYPRGQEREVESPTQVSSFREQFIERIASDIAMKFSASSPQRRID
jgi:hypothetical protein